MSTPVVVVGSGVSGVTAALVLAAAGEPVVVLESAPHTMPLLRGFRRSGHLCDTGFHYTGGLDDGGFLTVLFGRLGVLERIRPVALSPGSFDLVRWNGREIHVPSGVLAAQETLEAEFPASRGAVRLYFDSLRRILAETPFLNAELPPWKMGRTPDDDLSLAAFLERPGGEPGLVDLLGRYGSLLHGMNAREVPLRTHAAVLGSYLRSAHTVIDGGEAIADAFDAVSREAGVRVECGRRVTAIDVEEGGEVGGVLLEDGDHVETRNVIFTPHPALLAPMLPDRAVRPAYRSRLLSLENTPAFFLTYLLCRRQSPAADRNLYFLDGRKDEGADGYDTLALMAANPTPSGRSPLRVVIEAVRPGELSGSRAASGPRRSPEYLRWKTARSAAARERAARLAPELGLDTEVLDAATPASYEDWTGTVGGSAYGVKRGVSGIPLTVRTPVTGLYLAGQGLLMPGIMGAAASGIVAAGRVVGLEAAWSAMVSR